jgi:hypothetical protein
MTNSWKIRHLVAGEWQATNDVDINDIFKIMANLKRGLKNERLRYLRDFSSPN